MYCEPSLADQFMKLGLDFKIIDMQTDPSTLRQLDAKTASGKHQISLVTDSSIMRGTDFRAPIHGITLILAKAFTTERDAD